MTPRPGGLSNLPAGAQFAPSEPGEGGAMSNDHLRQRLPNRRFRRLFPAAVAAVTLAASAPFAAAAHADAVRPHTPNAAHAQAPGKIPTLLRTDTTRGDEAAGSSAA